MKIESLLFLVFIICFSAVGIFAESNISTRYFYNSKLKLNDNIKFTGNFIDFIIGQEINKNLYAGASFGNWLIQLEDVNLKLDVKDNLVYGLMVKLTAPLPNDFSIESELNYIHTIGDNYIETAAISDFRVYMFSNDLLLKKRFNKFGIAAGLQYSDLYIKSSISSLPNFYIFDLKNKNQFSYKILFDFAIWKNFDATLSVANRTVSAAVKYSFKLDNNADQPLKTAELSEKNKTEIFQKDKDIIVENNKKTEESNADVLAEEENNNSKENEQEKKEIEFINHQDMPVLFTIYDDLRNKGIILLRTGNYNDALNCFLSAKNSRPENPEIYKLIAETYEKLGNLEEAIKNYDKALNLMR